MSALRDELSRMYGSASEGLLRRLPALDGQSRPAVSPCFDQDSVVLLAYPDHVRAESCKPLEALHGLLAAHFKPIASHVHVLPPFPSSGDDGFAPIEHTTIATELGDWRDIARLSADFSVSIDLILNHVSPEHRWFRGFMAGSPEYANFFINVDPDADFSSVARSRHHPPMTNVGTPSEPRWLWTRYGPGQIDLNYRNVEVLAKMVEILAHYAARGVAGVRLDALVFVWKELGTTCSNRPEAATILRVLRRMADVSPRRMYLIAEADAIDGENPYVGSGDQLADLSYRYEAAPIILYSILAKATNLLRSWIVRLSKDTGGARVLNFLCTHDGIYLRPKAPPLPDDAIEALCRRAEAAGGHVVRRHVAGRLLPYELNVTVLDLLDLDDGRTLDRLFAALALVMTLPGVPLLYLGMLLGQRNDRALVARTGDPRSINRGKPSLHEAYRQLDGKASQGRLFQRLSSLAAARRRLDAFAPQAALIPLTDCTASDALVAFERRGRDTWARCHILLSDEPAVVSLPEGSIELITGRKLKTTATVTPLIPLIVGGPL